jgi:predicted RNA binding protein YcfA (HicA-like mRNA interferase family)
MPKLPIVKPNELLRVLKRLGFFEYHQVGSHIQLKHPDGRRVTVPFHKGKDIKKKTLKGILNDIDVSIEEFVKILKS